MKWETEGEAYERVPVVSEAVRTILCVCEGLIEEIHCLGRKVLRNDDLQAIHNRDGDDCGHTSGACWTTCLCGEPAIARLTVGTLFSVEVIGLNMRSSLRVIE